MTFPDRSIPRLLLVSLALGATTGCASLRPAPVVAIDSGILIEAEDPPAFVLPAGKRVETPFVGGECFPTRGKYDELPSIVNYEFYKGTRRVRVSVPGRPAPLHGLLTFCGIRSDFRGAAARSYQVSIPESYIDATSEGRVSVVYEKYSVDGKTYPAWVLWLAETPFPAKPVEAPSAAAPVPDAPGGQSW